VAGDIRRFKAFLLADIVGGRNLHFKREGDSTKWLRIWYGDRAPAGYQSVFRDTEFLSLTITCLFSRNVPSVDVIDWTTVQMATSTIGTRRKTRSTRSAPKSLAITGHVFLESVKQLQAN